MIQYKNSEAGLTAIVIIITIVLFFGWIINISQRECKTNKDCGSESYCGSDFQCHTYPTIQKTVVQYNFLAPSIILGIAIIIAAIIFNWNKVKPKEVGEEKNSNKNIKTTEEMREVDEIVEPYYKTSSNIKTP